MAQQGGGFGKVVLWVVLGIVGIIVAGWVLGALIGALLKILFAALVIAAIAGVAMLVVRAARRSVSGRGNRRQLPR
jgi:Na+/H+-translocating membrane pyrophosphatase